jgi:hypothetical protein
MASDNYVPTRVYGPFCRLQTPTPNQDLATAVKQVLSGELWGAVSNRLAKAEVQAYGRPLAEGESGIEFYALTAPDARWGPRPCWAVPGPHLVVDKQPDGREVARLRVAFVRITQDVLHAAASI